LGRQPRRQRRPPSSRGSRRPSAGWQRRSTTPPERLHHAAEKIERKLEPGLELFDLSPELVDESARNFIDIYGEADSIPRFVEALLTLLGADDRDRILGFIINSARVAAPEPEPIDPAFKASLSKPRRSRKAKSTPDTP
jgi:hypothetical protein